MIDWHDLVPADVADKQKVWERRRRIVRARAAGLTYREIGEQFGFSVERARQLYLRGVREQQWRTPVERYQDGGHRDLMDIVEFKPRERRRPGPVRRAPLATLRWSDGDEINGVLWSVQGHPFPEIGPVFLAPIFWHGMIWTCGESGRMWP